MRAPFAHGAVLSMAPEADSRAPGAAITVALCGHWEHEAPCPVAPHHTSAIRSGTKVEVRTLFVVDAAREAEVRERISTALANGGVVGPDGAVTCWQVRSEHAGTVTGEEVDLAQRLAS